MGRTFFFPKHSRGRLTAAACLALNATGQFFTHVQHTHTCTHIVNFLSQTHYDAASVKSSKNNLFSLFGKVTPSQNLDKHFQRLLFLIWWLEKRCIIIDGVRGVEKKKKANLHLLRAHGGLCITTLLKTCIKTSSSPNKYSYIYIFFHKLCIKSRAVPPLWYKIMHRSEIFRESFCLSLTSETCVPLSANTRSLPCSAHMYHSKKQQKKQDLFSSHHNHSMGTKNAHQHVHSRCLLHIKTHTDKGGFLLYPISTFTSSSQLQWQPKPSQPMFPTSMKATTQNDKKKKTFDSWPLLILTR